MSKGEDTRSRILAEATHLASVRGLAGVSLNDVAEAVGLSKSAVFKHFDSKDDLHRQLVDMLLAQFVEVVWTPAQPLPRGRARLETILDRWFDWVDGDYWRGGCPIMAMSIELDDQPGPLRDALLESRLKWLSVLTSQFRALADPPVPDDDAGQAAFEFNGLIMAYNEAKRLLGDVEARNKARRAFDRLCERAAAAGAATA